MKEKILGLYSSRKYAIWWTIFYAVGVWAILKFMFNFSIFSGAQWTRLMHAHLRGFPGFVFGILVLAAGPLYVATTAIIMRTGKPLFTIPLPKIPGCIKNFIKNIFTPTPIAADTPDTPAPAVADNTSASETSAPPPAVDDIRMPDTMPPEMRAQYTRVRKYGSQYPAPAPQPAPTPVMATVPAAAAPAAIPGDLPIPTDFDFESSAPTDAAPIFGAPVFSDIDFDTPTDNTAAPETDTAPIPNFDAPGDDYNGPVLGYLNSIGRPASISGTIVITGDTAIASHTDDDFWIADDTTWFAAGKTRPSPIAELMSVATENNARPVLYLGATNIMDLDARRDEWTAMGITVTTDIKTVVSGSD